MKLLKSLFVLKASEARLPDFQLTGCNGADNVPELSFRLLKSFVEESNFAETFQAGLISDGEYFNKTISSTDLTFMLDDEDFWSLNYEIHSDDKIVGGLKFKNEFDLNFKCRYSRAFSTNQDILVEEAEYDPTVGSGVFDWSSTVTTNEYMRGDFGDKAVLGERTEVVIKPKFPLPSIAARLIECEVSMGDQFIHPIHSFHPDGSVCQDNTLLHVETHLSPDRIDISYDAFHFMEEGSGEGSGDFNPSEQEHELTCRLQIYEREGFEVHPIQDCECLTYDQCEDLRQTQWADWGPCDAACGTGESIRERTCVYEPCYEPLDDVKECNDRGCVSDWTDWGECSAECGTGSHTRSRSCSDGVCEEHMDEEQDCNDRGCISVWTDWGQCNAECGTGLQERTRSCSDGVCDEHDFEEQECNTRGCLGEWTEFGECAKSCDGGYFYRTRACDDGECDEELHDVMECNTNSCFQDWEPESPAPAPAAGSNPAFVCEGPNQGPVVAELDCGGGLIHIESAIYGLPNFDSPNNGCITNSVCHGSTDHTDHVRGVCNGLSHCSYHSMGNSFGDPCGGTWKITEIVYSCSAPAPILAIADEIAMVQPNLVTDGFSVPALYDLSFDFMLHSDASGGWDNIMHVTLGGNNGQCGDRLPGIWTTSGTTRGVTIASCVGPEINHHSHQTITVNLGQWYHFEMGNRVNDDGSYSYYIILDGTEIHNVHQANHNQFDDMKMYIGDPWHRAAPGSIRNLVLSDTTNGGQPIQPACMWEKHAGYNLNGLTSHGNVYFDTFEGAMEACESMDDCGGFVYTMTWRHAYEVFGLEIPYYGYQPRSGSDGLQEWDEHYSIAFVKPNC